MKTFVKILFVALLPFVLSSYSPSKDFTGVVVYNISYDMENMDPQMASFLPKTMKMTLKPPMSRSEVIMGMGTTTSIFNADTKSGLTLMDMMGQKLAVKISPEDVNKELTDGGEVEVVETGETKDILGYSCKKVLVKVKDLENDLVVFYTEELSGGFENSDNPIFKDIKGMMLEFTMSENGMNMHFTAVNIDKKKVSDSEFDIPEGYETITQEEMQSRFGM